MTDIPTVRIASKPPPLIEKVRVVVGVIVCGLLLLACAGCAVLGMVRGWW